LLALIRGAIFVALLSATSAGARATAAAADAVGPSVVVLQAGKATGTYYLLAQQIVGAIGSADGGKLRLDLQESQGSVQNVIDAAQQHGGKLVFTAPPSIVAQARKGEKPFKRDRRYNDIRALFTIPYITVHWVVRADSGIASFADLAGKPFVPGARGSVAERQTAAVLGLLGLDGKVPLLDIDPDSALRALRDRQVSGVALSGPYPLPAVTELAKAMPIRLLALSPIETARAMRGDDSVAATTIPKGTYPSVDDDVTTLAIPVGVYTTRAMSEATAYALTKAFWTRKAELEKESPVWQATTPSAVAELGVKLHPGALRYYREAKVPVPAALR
jgi:TRAP transporter TAXI family solute receptor